MSAGTPIVKTKVNSIKLTGLPPSPLGPPRSPAQLSPLALSKLQEFGRSLVSSENNTMSYGDGTHASQAGNLDGQWISGPAPQFGTMFLTPSTPNTEFQIPHGLKRTPVGYHIARRSKACQIYDSSPAQWNSTDIFLKCDTASVYIALILF